MTNEEIEFMPSGLAVCIIDGKETRIIKISPTELVVRTADKVQGETNIKMSFYIFNKNIYDEIELRDYEIRNIEAGEFYYTYSIVIKDASYSEKALRIIRDYSKYVTMKTYGDGNEFSRDMTGYPEELDYDYYKFYSDQKYEWLSRLNYQNWDKALLESFELAIVMDNDRLYKDFLEYDVESFKKNYLEENYISNHPFFEKKIDRIYVGSQFCHNLFPKKKVLMEIMDKAFREGVKVTVCFTYLRQYLIEDVKDILEDLYIWCRSHEEKIEIVINDWGFSELIEGKKDYFGLNLGVLLNKRRKDPRYVYKNGFKEDNGLIAKSGINSSVFMEFLDECGISRYEYESCGYRVEIAKEKGNSINLPFYVTNTSQYCPLYAMCVNLDRGCQSLVTDCPKFCRDYVFMYPKHLRMIGRYNSLFGFDDSLLEDPEKLENYIKRGVDRVVLNFI